MRFFGKRKSLYASRGVQPVKYASFDFSGNNYMVNGKYYVSINAVPGYALSRNTAGYASNSDGTLIYYPPNEPRLSNQGLLVEGPRTNLATLTQKFGSWFSTSGTIIENAAIAPDGTKTATQVGMTGNTSIRSAAFTVLANNTYTFSLYVKVPAGADTTTIAFTNNTATTTFAVANYPSAANQWVRITCTGNVGASTSAMLYPILRSTAGTFYLWGAQFELGGVASSYVPVYDAITNLALQSNTLATAPWSVGNVTATNNTATAPDGTLTATTLTVTGTTGYCRQPITVVASTTYTFSFYIKLGTMTRGAYSVYNATASADIISTTTYPSGVSSVGWTRVLVTFTTPVGCTSAAIYPWRDGGVTGTVFIWGVQCELGYTARTYSPTGTTTSTIAAATSATWAGEDVKIGSAAGISQANVKSMAAQFLIPMTNGSISTQQFGAAGLHDGTGSNTVTVGAYGITNPFTLGQIKIAGATAKNIYQSSPITQKVYHRVACSFGPSDNLLRLAHNGYPVPDPAISNGGYTGTITFNQVQLGASYVTNLAPLSGYLNNLALYSAQLTQPQLNAVTAPFTEPSTSVAPQFLAYPIGDYLQVALSTSQAAYIAAASGVAVPITAAEYASIQTTLSGITITGLNDTLMNTGGGSFGGQVMRTTALPSSGSLMTAGYAVAFSIALSTAYTAGTTIIAGSQIGYATAATGAGTALCAKSTAVSNGCDATRRIYYVVKTPSVLAPAGGMPTIFVGSVTPYVSFIYVASSSLSYLVSATDVTAAPTSTYASSVPGLQILQTATKQWN